MDLPGATLPGVWLMANRRRRALRRSDTKARNRLLVPLTAANQPQAPPELRTALAAITRHVDDYANRARLPRAA